MARPIRAFALWLVCGGTVPTVFAVAFSLKMCMQWEAAAVQGDGSVGWNPRSVWIHWGPIPHCIILLGFLMAFCGVGMLAYRAAPPKVMIYGLVVSVVASLTLSASEPLRCAAFGPLLTAVLTGLVLLVIGLFRFILARLFRQGRESPAQAPCVSNQICLPFHGLTVFAAPSPYLGSVVP
jgi:hypothetical protein